MHTNSKRPKGWDGVLSSLNVAINTMNLAKDIVDIAPAQAAFGSVSALLTMIRVRFFYSARTGFGFTCIQDSMTNELDYINLGLNCADI